jgi:hypothetical protein
MYFWEKKSIRSQRKDTLKFGFLDSMITQDCLTEMNKTVEHWLNIKRGTWKIIKKAHLGEDGLSTRNYSVEL